MMETSYLGAGLLAKECYARYFGEVQGVGFRYTTHQLALELGLTGFVMNCSNGRVEALFQGKTDDIMAVLEGLQNRFSLSEQILDWRPETKLLRDFSIRRY